MRFVILSTFFVFGRSTDVQESGSTTIAPTTTEFSTTQTTTDVVIESEVTIGDEDEEDRDDISVDSSASATAGGNNSDAAVGGAQAEVEEDNDDSHSESSESSGFTSSDDEDETATTTEFKFDESLVGQCTADDKALWSGSDEFSRKIAYAASKGAGIEFRVKPLIQQAYATLSEPCVDCFTKAASCGAYWCMFSGCMTASFSKECITCIDEHCTPGAQKCIGATDAEMPPRPPITGADDKISASAIPYGRMVLFVGLPILAALIAYAYRK